MGHEVTHIQQLTGVTLERLLEGSGARDAGQQREQERLAGSPVR
jgi:hypothetical protein